MITIEFMALNIYEFDEIIRFSDCDPAGICYFGRYSTFFDESFIAAMRENKFFWDDHKKFKFLIPIVETKTQYYHPLIAGDTAKIYTTIKRVGNKSFTSQHKITKKENGKEILIAKGYISRVTVDYFDFKSIQIPEILKNILNNYIISEEDWEAFVNN